MLNSAQGALVIAKQGDERVEWEGFQVTGWTVRLSLVAAIVWSVMLPLRAGVEPATVTSLTSPAHVAGEWTTDRAEPAPPSGSEPWTLLLMGVGFIGIAALTSRRSDTND